MASIWKEVVIYHSLLLLALLVYPSVCKTYRNIMEKWDVKSFQDFYHNYNKLEDCLFKRVDDQEAGEYLSLICPESRDKSELEKAWNIVNGNITESDLQSLRISCVSCTCLEYHRTPQIVLTKKADTATRNENILMNYTEVSQNECTMPSSIESDMLVPFHNIETLRLSSQSVKRLNLAQTDGSPLFPNLNLLYILDVFNMSKYTFGQHGICTHLPSLALVQMQYNQLDSFPKSWFVPDIPSEALPSNVQLQCDSLQILLVYTNTLHGLQNNIFDFAINLKVLDLTSNQIQVIQESAFQGLPNLKYLILSNNSIETITEILFEPLKNISDIYLDENKLHSFNTSTVQQLTNLKKLDLSLNELVNINGKFPPLEILNVSYNNLHRIQYETFINCSGLKQLLLSNNQIISIDQGSFQFLGELTWLDLSVNKLQDSESLHHNIQNLSNLNYLNVSHNSLARLVPNMFQIVPLNNVYISNWHNLYHLDISFNSIHTISPNAFDNLEALIMLRIDNNPLVHIPQQALHQLYGLGYLFLGNTSISEFSLEGAGESVIELDLSWNNLQAIPQGNRSNSIITLTLSHNYITKLSKYDFKFYYYLTQLDISWNCLSQIHPYTFYYGKFGMLDLSHNELDDNFWNGSTTDLKLPRTLQEISLAHNHLSYNFQFSYAAQMGSFRLDMSYNPVKTLLFFKFSFRKLNLVMQNCNISLLLLAETEPWDFDTLDLRDNKLKEFAPIPVAHGNTDYVVNIQGNPIKCSCHMKWLQNSEYRKHYNVDNCEDILTHDIVPFDSVPNDRFLCQTYTGPNCMLHEHICICYTNGANINTETDATLLVDCSNKSLTKVPLPLPTTAKTLWLDGNNFNRLDVQSFKSLPNQTFQTEVLNLARCKIVFLEDETFTGMPYLKELHLENNQIQYINKGIFTSLERLRALFLNSNKILQIEKGSFEETVNLEVLNLAENKFMYLNQSTLNEISSLEYASHVSLGYNPWTCDCDNLTFKSWLQDHDHIITDLNVVSCNDTAIVNIPDDDLLCYDDGEFHVVTKDKDNWATVAVTSTIAAITSCLLIAGIIIYQNRFMCKVLLYNRFNFRLNVNENPDCQYDAFVIYDNRTFEVRNWIRTALLEKLEPQFRLCIPDRNILPGTIWADALSDAIQTSRRTILVLSTSGMEEEDILYAFQAAYHHNKFEDSTHRIFCILLQDADKKALISSDLTDPHVKAMLKAGQSFHVDESMFWDKVMFCMPKPQPRDDNIPMYYIS